MLVLNVSSIFVRSLRVCAAREAQNIGMVFPEKIDGAPTTTTEFAFDVFEARSDIVIHRVEDS